MTHSLDTVLIATSPLPEGREVVRAGGALSRAAGARVASVHGMATPAWFGEAPHESMGESGDVLRASHTALQQEIADEARNTGIRDAELMARRSADWTFVAEEQPQPTREELRRTTKTAT